MNRRKEYFVIGILVLAVLWLVAYMWSEWERSNKQVFANTPVPKEYSSPTNWPPTMNPKGLETIDAIARGEKPPAWFEWNGDVYPAWYCDCSTLSCDPSRVGIVRQGAIATVDSAHNNFCPEDGYAFPFGDVFIEVVTITPTSTAMTHTVTPTVSKTLTPTNTVPPSVTPTVNCLSQSWPVGDSMPVIPDCDKYMKTVQWNAYVYPKATTYDGIIPLGLRYRNCPSLFCDGIGTAYAYCSAPALFGWKCSDEYLYLEEVAYRLPVSEFGWTDEGYWGKMNRWGWYPLCVKLPQKEMTCYTDWEPSLAIQTAVEEWVTGLK